MHLQEITRICTRPAHIDKGLQEDVVDKGAAGRDDSKGGLVLGAPVAVGRLHCDESVLACLHLLHRQVQPLGHLLCAARGMARVSVSSVIRTRCGHQNRVRSSSGCLSPASSTALQAPTLVCKEGEVLLLVEDGAIRQRGGVAHSDLSMREQGRQRGRTEVGH